MFVIDRSRKRVGRLHIERMEEIHIHHNQHLSICNNRRASFRLPVLSVEKEEDVLHCKNFCVNVRKRFEDHCYYCPHQQPLLFVQVTVVVIVLVDVNV